MITPAVAPPDLAIALPYLAHASLSQITPSLSNRGIINTCGSIWAWISVVRVGVGVPCLGGGLPSLLAHLLQVWSFSGVSGRLGLVFWF